MDKNYSLVVFDMDGTILDTLEDLRDSVNYALEKCSYPQRTLNEIRSFVGNGIAKLIERSVPAGLSAEETDKVYTVFSGHYKLHCRDKTRPYDGINAVIKSLRESGCLTAVVSNKDDYAVEMLCDDFFPGMFDCAVGSRADIRKKPAPDSVNAVLEKLKIPRENAVYVGDSEVDVQTARNAGMDCIAVLWGFREREFLEKNSAETFALEPDDILKIILKRNEENA